MWQKLKNKIKNKLKKWLDCDCGKNTHIDNDKSDKEIKIINVVDMSVLNNFLTSSDGKKVLVNMIRTNKELFKSSLGVK